MSYKYKFGWIPDKPDIRDYTLKHENVKELVNKLNILEKIAVPPKIDLRHFCSSIFDQGDIGSCTANAGIGLVEFMQNKAYNTHTDLSRIFLYKTTRDLMQVTGDTGAEIRNTIGALATIGVCPEKYWKYNTDNFDDEPNPLEYALADNYKITSYIRLDAPNMSNLDVLNSINLNLAKGIPSIFGFTVYESIKQSESNGKIPYPDKSEQVLGGHAMYVVGKDDSIVITNSINKKSTTGAFIVANSWGTSWGDKGFGYLPYQYVLEELAVDWWIVLNEEWINSGQFGYK